MERFHEFLDSLHTPGNEHLLLTIVEGLYSIYGNNPHAADMGGELLTEESETNPKGFNERANAKHHELIKHRLAERKKATALLAKN
jgi:hypothetical protein